MLYELIEAFSIKGSQSFFWEVENIFGSNYMEQVYEQFYSLDTGQELATALVDFVIDNEEEILAYYKDGGNSEFDALILFSQLQEKLSLVEIC